MPQLMSDYLIKSYYKTASLMAHSCRGVCILNGGDLNLQEKCFRIGQHLGIAFQLIDDILDFTVSSEDLGKDSMSDIKEGNLNGPVLFAIQELKFFNKEELYEEMTERLSQKNISPEDLKKSLLNKIICSSKIWYYFYKKKVYKFIGESYGIEKTRYLAMLHAKRALDFAEAILKGRPSKNLEGLINLALKAVARKK